MKQPTATNFFERQESARKRTCLLVFLFILGVVATAVSAWSVFIIALVTFCIARGAIDAAFGDPDIDFDSVIEVGAELWGNTEG